ncbi:MAG: G/U mismatch-specific DNA glycosylase [Chloroflexi bacterium]|nr:G/U mismatch-specific DNA glycosylase [Chloroflexota bacterium]
MRPWRPSKEQLAAAAGKSIPDLIQPGLKVLFAGINPSLYSGAVGHHFARPGNRFWPVLHKAGFTPRLLNAFEERELLRDGIGITNFVARATATAAELDPGEFKQGAALLRQKVLEFQPGFLAIVGVSAYRAGFDRPKAAIGLQSESLGRTQVWVLPNPSGLQAHYQMPEMVALYGSLREAAYGTGPRQPSIKER